MPPPSITVLIAAKYYAPLLAAGGGVVTLVNMIKKLNHKINFIIITEDRCPGESSPYNSIQLDRWSTLCNGKVSVIYVSPARRTFSNLSRLVNSINYDVILMNGFFPGFTTFKLTILYKLKRIKRTPVILAPRGELHNGALKSKKFKKYVYIFTSKIFKLFDTFHWLVTDSLEGNDVINKMGGDQKIFACSDIPHESSNIDNLHSSLVAKKRAGVVRFVYISRVLKKKGLYTAISSIIKLSKRNIGHIIFDIYGPIIDKRYWSTCLKLIDNISSTNLEVNYCGELDAQQVIPVFNQYHFFIFPTLGENYGYVVHESLLAGCPIIITNNTPWKGLISKNIGFNFSSLSELDKTLAECLSMGGEEHKSMALDAHKYGQKISLESNSHGLLFNFIEKLASETK